MFLSLCVLLGWFVGFFWCSRIKLSASINAFCVAGLRPANVEEQGSGPSQVHIFKFAKRNKPSKETVRNQHKRSLGATDCLGLFTVANIFVQAYPGSRFSVDTAAAKGEETICKSSNAPCSSTWFSFERQRGMIGHWAAAGK